MKLVFCVIQNDDEKALTSALVDMSVSFTRISSSGGFLRFGSTTLMIGIEEKRLDDLLKVIKEKTQKRQSVTAAPFMSDGEGQFVPLDVTVGGATLFVTDVEKFIKY